MEIEQVSTSCQAAFTEEDGTVYYFSAAAPFTITLPSPGAIRAEIDDARKAATEAERARIIAVLADLKPPHRPRTHGDWARGWKEAGALELFDKMMAALGGKQCSE